MPRNRTVGEATPFNEAWRALVYRVCEEQGWNQEELAEEIGVGRSSVQSAMRRRNQVGLNRVKALADIAGMKDAERIDLFLLWVQDKADAEPVCAMIQTLVDHLTVSLEPAEARRLLKRGETAVLKAEAAKLK